MAARREPDRGGADRLRERSQHGVAARSRPLARLWRPQHVGVQEARGQFRWTGGAESFVQQVEHLDAAECPRWYADRFEVAADAVAVAQRVTHRTSRVSAP